MAQSSKANLMVRVGDSGRRSIGSGKLDGFEGWAIRESCGNHSIQGWSPHHLDNPSMMVVIMVG